MGVRAFGLVSAAFLAIPRCRNAVSHFRAASPFSERRCLGNGGIQQLKPRDGAASPVIVDKARSGRMITVERVKSPDIDLVIMS